MKVKAAFLIAVFICFFTLTGCNAGDLSDLLKGENKWDDAKWDHNKWE